MTAPVAKKTLSAWRGGVSYGEFFQPIRLTVQRPAPPPPAAASANPSVALEPAADNSANGKPQEAVANDSVLVIPAFESADITGPHHRVVLNAGGPVWAMDWLPTRAVGTSEKANQIASASATTSKPKPKRGRPPTCGKGKRERPESSEKENSAENAATSDSNATTEATSKQAWRFLALSTHPPCEVQDGQVVRPTPPDHYYDAQEGAPGLIQIWSVPVSSRAGGKRVLPTPKPRLVYGIAHSSGVAWEMQWSPLAAEMPDEIQARGLLGVLAVAFGDGSLQVFAVPQILPERLQELDGTSDGDGDGATACIEALPPLVTAKLPRIIPLCLQWSPRRWNLLLTGGSDGSIAMWNIEPRLAAAGSADEGDAEPMEPQRRFQDADTVGKQDAFDWGNGWAAVRAISWSPFDDFVFASTGNDSLFKIWDVREPRICLRSHRIRSTWGNAIQWINDTSIQISGDQGSIYHYNIVSGSYQKLHFHPQVDSPIWDIQLGRRDPVPILLSACASGSIRVAPARKLYRAPHNCLEFCRVTGRKSASIHDEYKELTVNFELSTILGSSEGMGPGIREFCERDAALHRLRITSARPHESPCLLACAGHAGLVLIFEMQAMLDNLIADHFQPPSKKKTGRPKKIRLPAPGASPPVAPAKSAPVSIHQPGRRHATLGSFVTVKAGGASAKKQQQKKKQKVVMGTVEYHYERGPGHGVVNPEGEEEEEEDEEEEEFDNAEESESDVSPDLDDDENSDDDRVIYSDNDVDEDAGTTEQQLNPNEVRLMTEYQLDLSEEDAILLAIQMSEVDQSQVGDTSTAASTVDSGDRAEAAAVPKGEVETVASSSVKPKKKAPPKRKAPVKAATEKTSTSSAVAALAAAAPLAEQVQAAEAKDDTVAAVANVKVEPSAGSAKKKPAAKKPSKKAKASPSKHAVSGAANEREQVVDQATALQMITYQRGMTEEEALMEAIRLSEMDTKRRSSRPKRSIAHVESEDQGVAGSTAMQSPSRRRMLEPPRNAATQSKWSPVAESNGKKAPAVDETKEPSSSTEPPVESVATGEPEEASVPVASDATVSVSTAETPPPVESIATASKEKTKKQSARQRKPAAHPRKKTAQSSSTPKPRADATKTKGKKKGKAPATGRRSRSDSLLQGVGGELLSEHEALLMALKTSEIEY